MCKISPQKLFQISDDTFKTASIMEAETFNQMIWHCQFVYIGNIHINYKHESNTLAKMKIIHFEGHRDHFKSVFTQY